MKRLFTLFVTINILLSTLCTKFLTRLIVAFQALCVWLIEKLLSIGLLSRPIIIDGSSFTISDHCEKRPSEHDQTTMRGNAD